MHTPKPEILGYFTYYGVVYNGNTSNCEINYNESKWIFKGHNILNGGEVRMDIDDNE